MNTGTTAWGISLNVSETTNKNEHFTFTVSATGIINI
jgi:hypothetical protein